MNQQTLKTNRWTDSASGLQRTESCSVVTMLWLSSSASFQRFFQMIHLSSCWWTWMASPGFICLEESKSLRVRDCPEHSSFNKVEKLRFLFLHQSGLNSSTSSAGEPTLSNAAYENCTLYSTTPPRPTHEKLDERIKCCTDHYYWVAFTRRYLEFLM